MFTNLKARKGFIPADKFRQVFENDANTVQDGPDEDFGPNAVPDEDEGEAHNGGQHSDQDTVTTLHEREVDVSKAKKQFWPPLLIFWRWLRKTEALKLHCNLTTPAISKSGKYAGSKMYSLEILSKIGKIPHNSQNISFAR